MSQNALTGMIGVGCSCSGLTADQKDRVQRDIKDLRDSVRSLKESAEQMKKCDKVDEVVRDTTKQLAFLDLMEQIIQKECN